MRPGRHPPSQRGVTLIEVMIAILIMAIISLISWRALDSVTRSDAQLTERTDATEDLLRAFQQLERDVALRAAMAQDRRGDGGNAADAANKDGTATTPAADGNRPATTTPQPASAAGRGQAVPLLPPALQLRRTQQLPFLLDIVRSAPAQPGQWQRVQWWWKDGTLFRAAGPASSRYPLEAPKQDDAAAVLRDVVSLQARAFTTDMGWIALPHADTGQAARGLEIQLGQQAHGVAKAYRRVFALE